MIVDVVQVVVNLENGAKEGKDPLLQKNMWGKKKYGDVNDPDFDASA